MRCCLAAMLLLALAPAGTFARDKPSSAIPESEITALQAEANRGPGRRATRIDKRRACKSVIRKSTALLDGNPAAPNRFPVLETMLQSQKQLLEWENIERNREAICATCSKLAQAPDEYAELRLEADMILLERAMAGNPGLLYRSAHALPVDTP